MLLPSWVPFVVAAWVILFGLMRLRMALGKGPSANADAAEGAARRLGYYGRTRSSHLFYGIAYILLGGYCIALGAGFRMDFLGACGAPIQRAAGPSPGTMEGVPARIAPHLPPRPALGGTLPKVPR